MRVHGIPLARDAGHKLGESLVYDTIRFFGSPFAYDVEGFENIQGPGPAIFVANHHGSIGPLAIMLSVPLRFYPWIVAEMMDPGRAPKYLFDDFVRPTLHLRGQFGLGFAACLTKITIPLFRSIGAVSIERFGGITPEGFRHSLRLLHEGKNLLVFPEDSTLPQDSQTEMRPFMPGFAMLCSLFQAEKNLPLPVYPVTVHPASEIVSIGKAEFYRSRVHHREAIDEFNHRLETQVKELYLAVQKSHADYLI